MIDTTFFKNKYSLDELVSNYLDEIKKLRKAVRSANDESKLQIYYQAVNTFKRVSIKDVVQFALSFGRAGTEKSEQMRYAFPILLGNKVLHPSEIDIVYAQLLLTYAKAFKQYRENLKDWLLRFVLNSRFSPVSTYVTREIDSVIENTQRNITAFKARI